MIKTILLKLGISSMSADELGRLIAFNHGKFEHSWTGSDWMLLKRVASPKYLRDRYFRKGCGGLN